MSLFLKSFYLIVAGVIYSSAAQKCGHAFEEPSNRIVGGSQVGRYTYPWIVYLTNSKSYYRAYSSFLESNKSNSTIPKERAACGGSLITTRDVLTAAHCLGTPNMVVVIGAYDNCAANELQRKTFKVSGTLAHPNYAKNKPWYDIGLVRLDSPAYFEPICLPAIPTAKLPDVGNVVGFGLENYNYHNGPCKQQEIHIPLYNNAMCRMMIIRNDAELSPNLLDLTNAFCAGDITGEKDACLGDSGGPLQYKSVNGIYTLYGIVSFGYECAVPGALGLYTDVRMYLDWIKKNTKVQIA